jgi:hypothetical protein
VVGGITINGLHHKFLQDDDRRGSKSERMVEQSSSVDQQSAFVNIPHQACLGSFSSTTITKGSN